MADFDKKYPDEDMEQKDSHADAKAEKKVSKVKGKKKGSDSAAAPLICHTEEQIKKMEEDARSWIQYFPDFDDRPFTIKDTAKGWESSRVMSKIQSLIKTHHEPGEFCDFWFPCSAITWCFFIMANDEYHKDVRYQSFQLLETIAAYTLHTPTVFSSGDVRSLLIQKLEEAIRPDVERGVFDQWDGELLFLLNSFVRDQVSIPTPAHFCHSREMLFRLRGLLAEVKRMGSTTEEAWSEKVESELMEKHIEPDRTKKFHHWKAMEQVNVMLKTLAAADPESMHGMDMDVADVKVCLGWKNQGYSPTTFAEAARAQMGVEFKQAVAAAQQAIDTEDPEEKKKKESKENEEKKKMDEKEKEAEAEEDEIPDEGMPPVDEPPVQQIEEKNQSQGKKRKRAVDLTPWPGLMSLPPTPVPRKTTGRKRVPVKRTTITKAGGEYDQERDFLLAVKKPKLTHKKK